MVGEDAPLPLYPCVLSLRVFLHLHLHTRTCYLEAAVWCHDVCMCVCVDGRTSGWVLCDMGSEWCAQGNAQGTPISEETLMKMWFGVIEEGKAC